MSHIFSSQEKQKIVSPEQLNLLVEVTRPRGWIVLTALCVIVLDALAWSIFGTLPLTIKGDGLLLKTNVVEIDAKASGVVQDILVEPGFRVTKGQEVATIRLTDIESKLEVASNRRSLLEEDRKGSAIQEKDERDAKLHALDSESRTLPTLIANTRNLLLQRENALNQARHNLAQQLIVESQFVQAQADFNATLQQLQTHEQRQIEINAERQQALLSRDEKARLREKEIADLGVEINALRDNIKAKSVVLSSVDGVVLEHMVAQSNMISEGKPIMRIEPEQGEVEAVIYVPAEEAKKISVDQLGTPLRRIPARINPTTIKPEEHGFILGEVLQVAAYPATRDGLMRDLKTDVLVDKLLKEGSPIKVTARLYRDERTPSGYRWSSAGGPPVGIASGTLCNGTFEVERKRPIAYVIPAIKKTLGLQ